MADINALGTFCEQVWDRDVVPALQDYVRIPNVSPAFDPQWAAAGHMAAAVELTRQWCCDRDVEGLTVEVVQLPGRTPVLLLEVPATSGDAGSAGPAGSEIATVLLYGHLDNSHR